MYVYTDVQVQGQHLNTNKQIEAITNNELHCMSSNKKNTWNSHSRKHMILYDFIPK